MEIKINVNKRQISELLLLIGILILTIYRVKVGNFVQYNLSDETSAYDAWFYIKNAINYNIFNVNADWPLIKNRSYMVFLQIMRLCKIDYLSLLSFTWIAAGISVYTLIKYINNKSYLAYFVYLFIIFNPFAFEFRNNFVGYRNCIFYPSFVIFLSCTLTFVIAVIRNNKIIFSIFCILLSLSLAFNYFLNEYSILYFALFIFLLIFCLIYNLYNVIIKIDNYKIFLNKLKYIVIAIIMFGILLFFYKYINYRTYGVFEVNMRTEGEVGRFVNNMYKIKSDKRDQKHWVPYDVLDIAYNKSDTFMQYPDLLEILKNSGVAAIDEVGYCGDFLSWGITVYMIKNKDKYTYRDFNKIFRDINNEIEEAFKNKKIETDNNFRIVSSAPAYSYNIIAEDIVKSLPYYYNVIFSYKDYAPSVQIGTQTENEIVKKFFGINDVDVEMTTEKLYKFTNVDVDIYKKIIKIMIISIIFSVVVNTVIFFYDIFKNKSMLYKVAKNSIIGIFFEMFFVGCMLLHSNCMMWFFTWMIYYDLNSSIDTDIYGLVYYYGVITQVFLVFAFIASFSSFILNKEFIINVIKNFICKKEYKNV